MRVGRTVAMVGVGGVLLAGGCEVILGLHGNEVLDPGASTGGSGGSSASTTSGASTSTSGASGASTSTSGGGGAGGLPATWHSWDVQTSASSPYVLDENGYNKAMIVPYQSKALNDLGIDIQLTAFNAGPLQDSFSHVQDAWTIQGGGNYPYVGKSSVGRGLDMGEAGAPLPPGVFDLQVFPADTSKLIVVRFVVPLDGYYALNDVGMRRVSSNGDDAMLQAYNDTTKVGGSLAAKVNQQWVTNGGGILGTRKAGDPIDFAVNAFNTSTEDATEITWTIAAQ